MSSWYVEITSRGDEAHAGQFWHPAGIQQASSSSAFAVALTSGRSFLLPPAIYSTHIPLLHEVRDGVVYVTVGAASQKSHGAPEPGLSVAVVVPTLNAGPHWPEFMARLHEQNLPPSHIIILDSGSTDGTDQLARSAGFTVVTIPPSEFNHGGTRQRGAEMLVDCEVIVYLTQDALLIDKDCISQLIEPLHDTSIGATYGRQLPRHGATPIEAHARFFNYPENSSVRCWDDREHLGIRATFLSNSFAAYRRSALMTVGGFPSNTIMAEDAIVAAMMLKAGWKIAYVAESAVLHSHPYSLRQEFRRYFDIGVFHHRESRLLADFGTTGREGVRFMKSEIKYLYQHAPYLLPSSLLRIAAKLFGYRLGRKETNLPIGVVRRLSMHKHFWDKQHA